MEILCRAIILMVTVNNYNKPYFISRVTHDGNHMIRVMWSPAITVTQKSASCIFGDKKAGLCSGK